MGEDGQLVERAVAGDREAFGQLYDRYATPVHDLLCRMLRDPHEASDALQDTFVTAGERLHQLRDPDRFRPWVYAIARRRAYLVTERRRRVEPTEHTDVIALDPDPTDALAAAELRRLLDDASGGLDPQDRLLLDLQVRHGLEGQDLADAVGVDRSHVHVMAHRLRERLERSLGALVLLRHGRDGCPQLAALVGPGSVDLTPTVRKRVSRHADGCLDCRGERDRRLRREALLGLVPFAPAPASAREAVLDRVELCSHRGDPWSGPDGLPPGGSHAPARRSRRRQALVAIVVALVTGLGAWVSLLADPLRPVVAEGDPETTLPSAAAAGGAELLSSSTAVPGDAVPSAEPVPPDVTTTSGSPRQGVAPVGPERPVGPPATAAPPSTAAPTTSTTPPTRPPRTTTTTARPPSTTTTRPPVVTTEPPPPTRPPPTTATTVRQPPTTTTTVVIIW